MFQSRRGDHAVAETMWISTGGKAREISTLTETEQDGPGCAHTMLFEVRFSKIQEVLFADFQGFEKGVSLPRLIFVVEVSVISSDFCLEKIKQPQRSVRLWLEPLVCQFPGQYRPTHLLAKKT